MLSLAVIFLQIMVPLLSLVDLLEFCPYVHLYNSYSCLEGTTNSHIMLITNAQGRLELHVCWQWIQRFHRHIGNKEGT